MADHSQLIYSVLKFFEEQQKVLPPDAAESLEVACQCLESTYAVQSDGTSSAAQYAVSASLPEIFQAGLKELKLLPQPKSEASTEEKENADKQKAEGNDLMKQERFQEALESYTRAIEIDGNNAVYYSNRAAAYGKLGEHAKSIADSQRALSIDPNYSKAYGRLGLAYAAQEKHKEAIECYQNALKLDPENESYQINLEMSEQNYKESQSGANPAAGLNMSGMDFSSFLNNPALMNMATSMMSNPQVQSMMANIMTGAGAEGGGNQGLGGLLQAGQHLAQQMQESNPDLVDQLRTQMRDPDNPDNEEDAPEGS